VCDFINSTQTRGHIELVCATISSIYPNTFTLSNLYLLTLFLSLFLVCKLDYIWQVSFYTLINSRFTHCFANFSFVYTHNLLILSVLSVKLYMFDRLSNNFILEIILLFIYFLSSKSIVQDFYVTLLNSSYSLVFEYIWLIQYNLLID